MVTMSMAVVLVAERVFGLGPRVEALIAVNLRAGDWGRVAPNTALVLLMGAAALFLRHAPRWFETRLWVVGTLGSIIFAIGVVACVGYMTGVPSYVWQSRAPMSLLSAICSCVLGLGIVMSACRYSELDESGMPQWFSFVVFTGALAVNLATAVAYLCNSGPMWNRVEVIGLAPMIVVSGTLWRWPACRSAIESLREKLNLDRQGEPHLVGPPHTCSNRECVHEIRSPRSLPPLPRCARKGLGAHWKIRLHMATEGITSYERVSAGWQSRLRRLRAVWRVIRCWLSSPWISACAVAPPSLRG